MLASYPLQAVPDVRTRLIIFALRLPEAFEDHPWGETVAKVGRGKVFVFFGGPEGVPCITVKLDESHGHALSVEGAEPTGYGLGRSGWVTIPIASASVDVLRDFIEESYRIVAPKRLIGQLDASRSL
jgi:predicted DNA-binding protein (MmcQ/YjbR family)